MSEVCRRFIESSPLTMNLIEETESAKGFEKSPPLIQTPDLSLLCQPVEIKSIMRTG